MMKALNYFTALIFFGAAGVLTTVESNPVWGSVVTLCGMGLLLAAQGICNAIKDKN